MRAVLGASPSRDLRALDVWLPAGNGPHPVALMVHGGCWQTDIADRTIMNWVADDLGRRGKIERRFAGAGKLAGSIERLRDGNNVRGLAGLDEAQQLLIDQAMIGAIEISLGDVVADLVPRVIVEQQTAEQRLLRLDRMRRQTQRIERWFDGESGSDLGHAGCGAALWPNGEPGGTQVSPSTDTLIVAGTSACSAIPMS